MKKFNNWLANKLSEILAAMWLFYLMNIVIWSAILIQRPQNIEAWLLAIISIWFQGVALVVINYTAKQQGDRMETKLDKTHDAVIAELAELKQLHKELHNKL